MSGNTDHSELANWRRQINDIYAKVRATDDPLAAWQSWHETRSDMFKQHPMSPLVKLAKQRFHQIPVFQYDPDLRFEVALHAIPKTSFSFNLGSDGKITYSAFAITSGLGDSLGGELTVYWVEGYGGGLFIPFGDATNGAETFGGGRYIIDAIKGADLGINADGSLILDFNFAYNPSCALNDSYICPLSPSENKLPVKIFAGEKLLTGH